MRHSQHTDQEILLLLYEADAGISIAEICSTAHISLRTFYRWRKRYGGLTSEALRHMKELEIENQRLRSLVDKLSEREHVSHAEAPLVKGRQLQLHDFGCSPRWSGEATKQSRGASRRWVELNADLDRNLEERGVKNRIEPSFSIVLPLIEAAIDENRTELKLIWDRLLANACDPSRSSRVRISFIEIVKKLDPLDALILQKMATATGTLAPNARDFLKGALGVTVGEIMVSFENMTNFGLLFTNAEKFNPHITDKGALLFRAIEE